MKKWLCLAGMLLCLLPCSRPAEAAYVTAEELAVACLSDKPEKFFGCLNYVAGVVDYHVMMQSLGTIPTIDFCLPKDLPLEEAAVAVMRYLRKSPQHDSFIAAPAITMALHETYPCAPMARKKKKR